MAEPLEALYPRIGQTIINLLEIKWDEVNILVSVKPGVIQLKCFSIDQAVNTKVSFTPNRGLVGLFRELHERMVLELNDNWKTADFKLMRNGKFEINFGYEG